MSTIEFKRFFRDLSTKDKTLIAIGTASSVLTGILLPMFAFLTGDLANTFDPNYPRDKHEEAITTLGFRMGLLGFAVWIFGYIFFGFWQHTAENIIFKLRSQYLNCLLRLDIQELENMSIEQLPSQLGENFNIIQESLGQRFSLIVFSITNILAGIVVAFIFGPDITAIFLVIFPILLVIVFAIGARVQKFSIKKQSLLQQMGGVVEESLMSIKLITSFSQEEKEIQKFEKLVDQAKQISDKSEHWIAAFIGFLKFVLFWFYAFETYLGTFFIQYNLTNPSSHKDYIAGDVITVVMSFIYSTGMIFNIIPNIQSIIKAKVAGKQIFEIIDREQNNHAAPELKIQNFEVSESIIFDKVTFKYQKANKEALKDASFTIKANKSTAIVGNSGCGKTTIIQLIERFYEPNEGKIYFDKLNIYDIDLRNLRESIGLVQQEPVLIMGTIRDNILLGNKDASLDQIKEAIKVANAEFIYEFENSLDTYVGSSNILNLSGGQKQRIAIARALIKNPKILILDEATSALDPKSEKDVQKALLNIQRSNQQLTIIVIAHRIQTILSADNLIYLDKDYKIVQASKNTDQYHQLVKILEENCQWDENSQDPQLGSEKQIKFKSPEQRVQELNESIIDEELDDQIEKEVKDFQLISMNDQTVKLNSSDQDMSQKEYGMKDIMKYYKPNSKIFLAFIATFLNAFSYPVYGYIFAKVIFVMIGKSLPTFIEDRNFWCGSYMAVTFGIGLFEYFKGSLYSALSENLTSTLRKGLFNSMIKKNIEWFDKKERAPGILSSLYLEDISHIKGLTSQTQGLVLEAILCLIIGITLAFISSWKIALVTLSISPLLILGGVAEQMIVWGSFKKSAKQVKGKEEEIDPYDRANALLSDIIINYKTVIGLGQKNVEFLVQKYQDLLEEPRRNGIRQAHISGIIYGYSQSIRLLFLGLIFYIATIFLFHHNDDAQDTFVSIYTLFMSAMQTGSLFSQVPSISKSKQAANKILSIIESKTADESLQEQKSKSDQLKHRILKGEIEFKNVSFKYPSREKIVLNSFSLQIPLGRKVALVGHSGSGKSTITSLLLRLYDFEQGQILIDGVNLKDFDVKSLRNSIGYVMQEPLLFNMSIKENIIYGNDKASDEKIREVAELANALEFIENFEDSIEGDHTKYPQKIQKIKTILNSLQQTNQDCKQILEKRSNDIENQLESIIKSQEALGTKEIIQELLWNSEQENIKEYLSSEKNFIQYQEVMLKAFKTFKKMFDLSTVVDFVNRANSQAKFEDFIAKNQERIRIRNEAILSSLDQLMQNDHFKINTEMLLKSDKLHPGFNKICGLKGSMLSGGQKQRIAIARALIKDPKILILDEATSALDEQSQELVNNALEKAMVGRTSIVIAHRLSTIKNCDWICVLHNGQVVEQGIFQKLSEDEKSYFYKLKSGMEM
ncbi:abc transporter [Stylonychia lemnae]|uniref:Abc transporter n=1 Tax=Stylonychia lemnae TaxID=5949 RepID=A0A078BAI0_STYLE|nr:abc transporter [Stylonychia lemnae]|eukprot:CDW90568.1 abc transporter [Stylonychia lemnae]